MKRVEIGFILLAVGSLTLTACGSDERERSPAGPLVDPTSVSPVPVPQVDPSVTEPGAVDGEPETPVDPTCGTPDSCGVSQCTCSDGSIHPTPLCRDGVCADEQKTCAAVCEEALREPPTPTPEPPPVRQLFGCRLSSFNDSARVRAVFFGAGSTESSARLAGIAQCVEAGYVKYFCEQAVVTCNQEDPAPSLCTWTNIRPGSTTTISFKGDGASPSAASAAAVQKCIEGGWGASTCGSGSLVCARK